MKPENIKICLNAMVANEEPTILRMLNSCYQYIDYWVIQDNGSKDNTKELISDFFHEKKIPGFLYEVEWKYPGWNRDHTLQKALFAKHSCQWILRMDADEELKVDESFDWNILKDVTVDSWNVAAEAGNYTYYRTWLWNSKRPWYFKHSQRHETIHINNDDFDFQRETLPTEFRHIVKNDGQTWANPTKFIVDGLELEKDLLSQDSMLTDDYHLYHLGKSYSDGYLTELPFGKNHQEEYARRCIFYLKNYVHHNPNYIELCYYSLLLIGSAHAFLKEDSLAKEAWSLCSSWVPERNEHLFKLADFYEARGMYVQAYEICKKINESSRIYPFPNRYYLVDRDMYIDTGDKPVEYLNRLQRLING